MYGQTPRAYQMLVDAYSVVLGRMRLKNLVLPVAMIVALCGGRALANHAGVPDTDIAAPTVASGPTGTDGTYAYTHTVDPNGVFAGPASPLTRTQGQQPMLMMYFRDAAAPDMHNATAGAGGYGTWYNVLASNADSLRSYFAAMSGGRMDFDVKIVDVPLTARSDGALWEIGTAQSEVLPDLGINRSDYRFGLSFFQPGTDSWLINNPNINPDGSYYSSGLGSVAGPGTSGGGSSFNGAEGPSTTFHEVGHNFSLNHYSSLGTNAGIPSYVYNYATRTYDAAPAAAGPVNAPIGLSRADYGGAYSMMSNWSQGMTPRQKQSMGWLDPQHFANIGALVAPNTTGTLKLYDDMVDMPVVVSASSGPDVKYGVAHGYRDVHYNASFTRQGQAFHADSANTGHWESYAQRFDFFYRSGAESYPGFASNNETPGIAVDLNGAYLGRLTLGQTLLEKDVANNVFVLEDGKAHNMDDGSKLVANADLRSYAIANRPQDPARYRSTWYQITYMDNGVDANGHWANLQIQAFSGAQLTGWQFDANGGTAGTQDGSGTWTAGGGNNWRNITLGVDNQNWTQDEDAVFGAGGAAGTVTIAAAGVTANSLAFRSVNSGNYTLTGGPLTLTYGGIVADESATIASALKVAQNQFWTVAKNETLTVGGSIDTTASLGATARKKVSKDGQGTLVLGGATTWNADLSVNEGLVRQTADQSFVGENVGGNDYRSTLRLGEGATYQVAGGTLKLGALSQVSGLMEPGFSTINRNEDINQALGTLRLSSATGSTAAPELWLASDITLRPDLQLDAGAHFINNDGTSKITGDVSGAGGITLYGNASNRRLELGGRIQTDSVNTFTGDIEIRRGSLHVVGASSLQGNNVLRFNTASGDTGRFYLRGFDRSVRDLSSTGVGSAVIANARGSNVTEGVSPVNLTVTQNNDGTYGGTLADTANDSGGSGTAGALGLVKKGNATLTLAGTNTYTGGTAIQAGTLRVKGADNLGSGTVRLTGGTLSIDQAQGLTRTALAGSPMNTGALAGGGTYTSDLNPLHNASGNIVPSGTTYAYTGKIYLTTGQWSFGENFDSGAYLKVDSTVVFNDTRYYAATAGIVNIAADGWYDIDLRAYSDGGGVGPYATAGWTTQGIGVKTGAASTDGTLYTAFNAGALGLKLKDTLVIANDISVDAASNLEILDAESISDVRLTGTIGGAGALTKTGAGMVTLAGINTHTGATRISSGTVAAGAADVLGSASAYTLDNAAGVALNLNGFNQTIGSLAGGGTAGGTVALGAGTLTVGGDHTDTSYAGTLTGTGGLRKVGTGTMRLDFANAAVASNILSSSSALTLGGGTLELRGKSGAVNTQTVSGLTLMGNTRSALKLVRNDADTLELRLGNIAVGTGATLDFQGGTPSATPGTGPGAWFSFTTVNGGAIGADARLGAFATWNGTDWAANSGVSNSAGGTYIQAYTGYTNIYNGSVPGPMVIQTGAATDVRINEASSGWGTNTLGASSVTLNSLLMSAAGHAASVDMTGRTLTVGGGANATGAVAVGAGAKGLTLGTAANQGTLTSGASGASILGLISNNAAAIDGLTVNAVIANGGTGTTALLVSGGTGGGTVVLAGNNTYSGGTTVVSGATLKVGAGGATGTLGSGSVALEAGTELLFSRNDAGLTVAAAISGAGDLTQGGAGTTTLSGANTYSGATTILAGGTLRIGAGGASGTLGTANVVDNGTLAFNRSDIAIVSNGISGTGTVAQTGSGTTVLTGANAYGATTISAGILQVGNDGTEGTLGSGAVTVAAGGRLAFNRSDDIVVANAFSGAGALSKNGDNTLVYTGTDTRTGTTAVSGGTLQIGAGGAAGTLGSGATTLAAGAVLEFNRNNALAVASAISGAGTLLQSGAGTTTLTGANTYGATRITDGILQVGDGGQLGTGAVALEGGDLDFRHSGTLTAGQAITISGTVSQTGTGTTILTGNNTYAGTTRITDGILQVGNGGTTGSLGSSAVDNDAQLVFNRSNTLVVANAISGEGTLRQSGAGTLVITGNNTYEGGTTIDAGRTLQLGNGGAAGSLGTGDIIDNGTLAFNRTNGFTVSAVISGGGNVVQNGSGTTRLSGANTYAGTTTVNAGILQEGDGAAAGKLGTGDVTVNTGGTLQFNHGNNSATTTANRIVLAGGTVGVGSWYSSLTLNGELAVGALGGTLSAHGSSSSTFNVNGLVTGSGALALANRGTFNVNNAANTYSGTLTVGAHTSQTLDIGATTALRYATVNLAPASSATNLVTFAPTVAAATFGGLTGNAFGGMRLQNRAGGSPAVALTVDNAVANQFDGVLSGTGSLIKTGAGVLTLTHANTHTGGTTVSSGVLALDFSVAGAAASNILSSSGAVTLNGGTLKIIGKAGQTGTVQSFASLSSGAGASTLQLVQNGATTMDVNVGALAFGSGTLNFTGATGTAAGARVITNTTAGANDSQTQLSAASALWNGSDWASVQISGGTKYVVKWAGAYTDVYTGTTGGRSIVIPTGGAATNVRILENGAVGAPNTLAASTTTVASLLMNAATTASVVKMNVNSADDTLVVGAGAGANGNLAIAATGKSLTIGSAVGEGVLTAGSSGASTLSLANANAVSTLTINADIANNAGAGAVSLVAGGAGAIILKGTNTHTGSTTVGGGTNLQITGSLGTAGVYAGNILDNGTLRLSHAGDQTLSGTLSGTGTLAKDVGASSDILTLSGVGNTISGNINVSVGTLKVGSASALGSANVAMANGTTLNLNGFSGGTPLATLGGTGVGGTGALINAAATQGSLKGLTLSGDLLVSNTNTQGAILIGSTTGQDGVFNLAGHTLTKNGNGTLILNGVNATADGDIIVNAGTLQFMTDYWAGGQQNTTLGGTGTLTINAGAALSTNRWSSAFSLTKDIVLNGGTIRGSSPGPNGATIASDITVTADSAVSMGGGYGNITFSGDITGAGGLTFTGDGSARTFSGTSSYSGATLVNAGLLKGGAANAFSANSAFTLANTAGVSLDLGGFNQSIGSLAGGGNVALGAGTLTLGANNANASYAGVIGGTGGLTKVGSGTQTFTKAQTYTGLTTVSGGTLALDYTAGNNILASGGHLMLAGGTVRFDNLGTAKTQTFGTTTLASGTHSTLLRGAGWTSGIAVNLGTLGSNGGGAALEVSDIVAAPSWIMASGNLNQATLLAGAVTTNAGANLVGTDASGNLILATSGSAGDYVRNATLPNNAAVNVRLIGTGGTGTGLTGTGFAGLATVGTTDFGTLLNAYASGTSTVDITNSGANAANILRMGAAGAIVATAGSDLVIGASVAEGGTLTAGGAANAAGTLSFNAGNNITVNAAIANNGAGSVALTKTGAGTLTLVGADTYGGLTTINQGTLQIGNGGTTGTLGSGNVVDDGILAFNRSNTLAVSNAISGTGSVNQLGTGTTTFTGSNTYAGATTITRGTLAAGAHNTLSANSDLTVGGAGTTGTLNLAAFSESAKSLAFGAAGGTLKMAANQTGVAQLTASGAIALGTTNTLDLTGMGTTAGLYRLVAGSSLTGTFGSVTGLDSAYVLKYGSVNANELDAQHRATVTLAADAAYHNLNVRTGTRTIGVQVSNTAPIGSLAADYVLAATGVSGLSGGTRAAGVGFDGRTGTYTATAGINTKTVNIANTGSDAWTHTPSSVNVTQTAYDYANAKYAGGNADFGNVRKGAIVADKTVAFGNQTVANAAYQDSLNVSATTGNTKVTATGFTGLGASASGATTHNLSLAANTASAGSLASTATLTLVSNANGVAGLSNGAATVVGSPAAITTTGGVYDYANAKYTGAALAFGNVRVGASVADKTVAFGNQTVTNAAYQDSLDVSATTGNTKVTATGFTGLGASTNGVTTNTLKLAANTATAGSLASTANLTLTSNANGVAGLSNGTATVVGSPAAITTTGAAYDYAAAKYTGATLDFGNVHAGASVANQTVAFGNQTVTDAAYQDSLDVSATTGNAKVIATGFTGLGASTDGATSNNLSFGVNTASAGSLASTATLNLVSNANGVAGLSNGTASVVGSPTAITTLGQVYSGLMNWTAGSGAWATDANWTDSTNAAVHVAAGLDAAFTGVDTATFTGSGGTVNLDGANANLKSITFNGVGNFTLAEGAGGGITLAGTSPGITVAGTQTLGAPLTLANHTGIAVTGASDSLTVSGAIGQSGGTRALTKTGNGTLTLTGANTYTGATTVSGGTLALDFSAAGAPATDIVSASSSLFLNGGTLVITGASGQNGVVQSFNGLTNVSGASTLRLVQGDATTMDISLGAISLNSGTINFVGATGTSLGARLITSSFAGSNDGHTQLAGTSALWNGSTWASVQQDVDGTKYVVQWVGTYSDAYTGTDGGGTVMITGDTPPQDLRILEGGSTGAPNTLAAATTTLNSLLMTAGTTESTIRMTVDSANATLVMGGGAEASANIAIAVGAQSLTIGETANQGFLTAGTSGDSTLNLANAGAGSILTINAIIKDNAASGKVALVVGASGAVLGGDNTYSGGTTLTSGGTLQVGTGGDHGSLGSGNVNNAGALVFNRSDAALEVSNAIVGAGSLTQDGTGTTTLTGANAYDGLTTIARGTLQIGNGGNTGSLGSGNVANNGTLAFNRGNDMTVANAISGLGGVRQIGAGTTTLAGSNTYSGATSVEGGTLKAGANNRLSANSDLTVGGASSSGTLDLAAFTANAKSLSFGAGGGTLKMAANQTGAAQLTASGAVALGTINTLDLTGMATSAGLYRLVRGGNLTGTFGSVTGLDSAYVLKYGSVNANEVDAQHRATVALAADAAYDNLNVRTGTRTIGVQVSNTAPAGSIAAAYSLSASGVSGLANGSRAAGAGFDGRTGTYTAVAGINHNTVSIANTGADAWTNAPADVTVTQTAYDYANAKYAGAAFDFGNLHVGAAAATKTVAVSNQTVADAAYQDALDVSVDTGNAAVTGTGFTGLEASDGGAATDLLSFSVDTSSAANLAGTTMLTLTSNANGVVGLSNGAATVVGSPTAITTAGQVYSGLMNWTAGSGSWATHPNWTDSTHAAVHVAAGLDAAFTGVDTATFTGTGGTVNLDGADVNVNAITFTSSGNYTLAQGSGGSLTLAGVAPLGGLIPQAGLGALAASITSAGTQAISAPFTLATNLNVTVTGNADRLAISGVIGESGAPKGLAKLGNGTLTLTGANAYTGATLVTGGTLALDFSAAGAPAVDILAASSSMVLNGGTLRITGTAGQSGVVQSFDGLTSMGGTSTLVLAQNGATTMDISLGTIAVNSGTLNFTGATGTALGARLITSSSAGDNDGHTQLAGTVALWNGSTWASVQDVGGVKYVVAWMGISDDVYTGTDGGTVVIPDNGTPLDVRILEGGSVGAPNTLAAATTTLSSLLMTAGTTASVVKMNVNSANDTLVMGGGANADGNILVAATARSLTIGSAANEGFLTAGSSGDSTLHLANANGDAVLTLNAVLKDNAGGGKVAAVVAGDVVFAGDNTHSGGTTLAAGAVLRIGSGAATGSLGSGNVANAGTLVFDRSDAALNVSGVISGAGALTQAGTGATTLAATNTYTGATSVVVGTLAAGAADAFGINSAVTVGSGATLDMMAFGQNIGSLAGGGTVTNSAGAATLTIGGNNASTAFSGDLTEGTGVLSLVKNGTGTQTFSAAVDYAGTTDVHGGTLAFATSAVLTGQVTVDASSTLAIGNGSGAPSAHLLSFVSAANHGLLRVNRDGRLNLSAANSLTGNGTLAVAGTLGVTGAMTTSNTAIFLNTGTLRVADGSTLFTIGNLAIESGAKIAASSTAGFTPGVLKAVVHSSTDINGSFAVDSALSATLASGWRWITRTEDNDVLLGFLRAYLGTNARQTPQQRATAGSLNQAILAAAVAPDIRTEYDRLMGLSDADLNGALDRLSGHDRAVMEAASMRHAHDRGQNMVRFTQSVLGGEALLTAGTVDGAMRATALGDVQAGGLSDSVEETLQFFVRASHIKETQDAQSTGVMKSTADGDLFTVGLCEQMTPYANIGLAFTYDMTDTSSNGGLGKSKGKTYGLDLFSAQQLDRELPFYVAGNAGIGFLSSDNERHGITPANLTATSKGRGVETHVSGEIGYKAEPWRGARLTPYAGLSYVNNTVKSMRESLPGAPGLALGYGRHQTQSFESTLGADFAQHFNLVGGVTLTPSVGIAWHHQLSNTDADVVSTHFAGAANSPFNTYLGALADDAVEFTGAVAVKTSDGMTVSVNIRSYRALGSSNGGHQNSVGASLMWDF